MVVANDRNYPPQSSIDETTRELVGFDVEVAEGVAAILGLEVSFKNPEWEDHPGGTEPGAHRRLHRLDGSHARERRGGRLHEAVLLRARPSGRQAGRAPDRRRGDLAGKKVGVGAHDLPRLPDGRTPTPSSRPTRPTQTPSPYCARGSSTSSSPPSPPPKGRSGPAILSSSRERRSTTRAWQSPSPRARPTGSSCSTTPSRRCTRTGR